jgi:hypothetical protein
MTYRARMAITILIAALALAALASTSALAVPPGWMINGETLSGSEALATTAKVDEVYKLKSSAANVSIECNGSTLNMIAPEITSPSSGSDSSLEFTGCKALTANCTLSSSSIKSTPSTLELTLEGVLAVIVTLRPKTKTTMETFLFEGEKCASEGLNAVTGTAKLLLPTGQDERTLQLVNSIATEASDELKVASSAAELRGSVLIGTGSGDTWSYL